MSQKEAILRFLNDKKDWFFNYQLQGRQTKYGWLGSQADRRARELTGPNGDKPSFEYEGEYRGIRYLIKGRLISRVRQYYVEILEDREDIKEEKKIEIEDERLERLDSRQIRLFDEIESVRVLCPRPALKTFNSLLA